jgi:hypothetical protein
VLGSYEQVESIRRVSSVGAECFVASMPVRTSPAFPLRRPRLQARRSAHRARVRPPQLHPIDAARVSRAHDSALDPIATYVVIEVGDSTHYCLFFLPRPHRVVLDHECGNDVRRVGFEHSHDRARSRRQRCAFVCAEPDGLAEAGRSLASRGALGSRTHLARPDRGVKRAPGAALDVLAGARMPAILCGISFLTPPGEAEALRSDPCRQLWQEASLKKSPATSETPKRARTVLPERANEDVP